MKKILLIADQFPPEGGPGVQRTLKFVKYLQSFGYSCYVFTRESHDLTLRDDTLVKDIPKEVSLIKNKSFDVMYKPNIIKKIIYYKLLIPDGRILWYIHSKRNLIKTIKEINPDIVYSTSAPYSDHLLGLYAKKKLPNIKWVADFRDEWTNNPYFKHNMLRNSIEKKLEKSVMEMADQLITNTPVMLDNFIKSYPFAKDKFSCISNGYDPEDFNLEIKKEKNKKFTLTYTGSLYGNRKPDTFFEALSSLIKEDSLIKGKILVQFIGNIKSDQFNEQLQKYNLTNQVVLMPYMSHKKCLNELASSDCSLLIEGNGKGNNAFYTGKVFEYIYVNKPILAVIPKDGAAAQLIKDTGTGIVVNYDDITNIKETLKELFYLWTKNKNVIEINSEEIKKYHRKALTVKLCEIFDKMC